MLGLTIGDTMAPMAPEAPIRKTAKQFPAGQGREIGMTINRERSLGLGGMLGNALTGHIGWACQLAQQITLERSRLDEVPEELKLGYCRDGVTGACVVDPCLWELIPAL